MLDIGKLSPGAADYYVGEVATSAEDYYTGKGETKGRWVGSLAAELGLSGEVDPDHFRRLLQGKHPYRDEYLVSARGSAARAAKRRATPEHEIALEAEVDVLRAAAHLGVSGQYVRRLLVEGQSYLDKLRTVDDRTEVPEPSAYLIGAKSPGDGTLGSDAWTVSRSELERFIDRRKQTKARPGFDLTLRPPKSVSVLWALTDEGHRAQIRQAHAEAVDEVVRYYEMRAVFVRNGGGSRHLAAANGIVAAAFDHRTSRAGDPLLHTHVVTANMTCAAAADATREWRTIPGAGLYEHARAAGHLYQAHLRQLLTERLGVEFLPVVNGYAEIVGVPDHVTRLFSKRRQEITEVLSESGNTSARAAQVATLETRSAKDYGVDAETLEARWRAEADDVGFDPEKVAACFDRHTATELTSTQVELLMDTLGGAHGLTERSATFSRTDVIEAVASAVGSAATARRVEELADRFLASSRALLVDRSPLAEAVNGQEDAQRDPQHAPQRAKVRRSSTQKLYTTPGLAALEEELLHSATKRRSSASLVSVEVVDAVIRARPELSAEQKTMIRAACTSNELIQPMSGRPGAGKTYAAEAVVAAHVASGIPIIGCSVSATAATELERAVASLALPAHQQ